MAAAYLAAAERGDPDAVYLACSGRSTAVRTLVEQIAQLARLEVTVRSDATLRREGEQPDLYGSPARLAADTGWAPRTPLRVTLGDTLDWWRERVAAEEG
jgi:GDP-4-dehydro-6-deoxy-D-mannose reductase